MTFAERIYLIIEAAKKNGWDLNSRDVAEVIWWDTVHGSEN